MKTAIASLRMLIALTVLTGIAYPLLITGIAQVVFQDRANGSLLMKNGAPIGSRLIAQKTESNRYFWPRPSAVDYNPIPSGGTNLGPTAKKLKDQFDERAKKIGEAHSSKETQDVPQDLLFASASGLDPEISPFAAQYQISRVAKARQLDEAHVKELMELVQIHTADYQLGALGERRVNVLELNLALDGMTK